MTIVIIRSFSLYSIGNEIRSDGSGKSLERCKHGKIRNGLIDILQHGGKIHIKELQKIENNTSDAKITRVRNV